MSENPTRIQADPLRVADFLRPQIPLGVVEERFGVLSEADRRIIGVMRAAIDATQRASQATLEQPLKPQEVAMLESMGARWDVSKTAERIRIHGDRRHVKDAHFIGYNPQLPEYARGEIGEADMSQIRGQQTPLSFRDIPFHLFIHLAGIEDVPLPPFPRTTDPAQIDEYKQIIMARYAETKGYFPLIVGANAAVADLRVRSVRALRKTYPLELQGTYQAAAIGLVVPFVNPHLRTVTGHKLNILAGIKTRWEEHSQVTVNQFQAEMIGRIRDSQEGYGEAMRRVVSVPMGGLNPRQKG
jgi:hypothetical protein